MKLSEHWLREKVNPEISHAALVEQLTMAGLEVDSVEAAAPDFSGILIGKVISTSAHPDATKLTLCKIDVGSQELLDIVCGAANVRADLKVAVATVGAVLPGGMKIKSAKLRGEISLGMLCSESELGLAEKSNGIMELPQESPIGVCIRKFLNLDDQIIEIDLTPNRGDCLSLRGIAREVAALNNTTWQDIEIEDVDVASNEVVSVKVEEPSYCPNYICRIITDIKGNAAVPLWMTERLRRSGLRSHSLVVDITNYVMIELGQPMHAFDADKVKGQISVRLSKQDELITLLDEQKIKLRAGTLVIADDEKLLAIAGIMGCLDSSVTDSTTKVIFESAHFAAIKIAGIARSYGLATDSSYRFERGVAPELQQKAIMRASSLLQRFAGGTAGKLTVVTNQDFMPQAKQIILSKRNVNRLLGMELSIDEISSYLNRLDLKVTATEQDDVISVNVPAFRFDISIEADLIEEVARIHGYNKIPLKPIMSHLQAHKTSETTLDSESLRFLLVDLGYSEAINYSFICPDLQALVYSNRGAVDLLNPLSKDLSQMRQGLMVGLLNACSFNLSRQVSMQKLFEVGLCFERSDGQLNQINRVAGLICGAEGEHDWSKPKKVFDYYDLKGDVEKLFGETLSNVVFKTCQHKAFHPGKSALIDKNGQTIGYLGELHPSLVKAFSLSQTPLLFEIDIDSVLDKKLPSYKPLSKFPSISRDLSFVLSESINFAEISKAIYDVKSEVPLQSLELFDVYQGDNIESGKKSIAIGLTLQHPSRTLVDLEVNDYMSAILVKLQDEFSIILRE